jgi:hypothetical protein
MLPYTVAVLLEMDCAFSLRYFSGHGDAVHRQRYTDCHRTAVTDFVMMVDSMDMGTTDLSAEAGLDGSGMGRSTTDTAELELTELAH